MTLTPLLEATTELIRALHGRDYRLTLSASSGKIMLENNVITVKRSGKVSDNPRPGVGEPLKLQKVADNSALNVSERIMLTALESLGDGLFSIMGSSPEEFDIAFPENQFFSYRAEGMIAHDSRENKALRERIEEIAPEVTFVDVDQFREALKRASADKLSSKADAHGKIEL